MRRADTLGREPLLVEIAEKIRRKIEWPGPLERREAAPFLRDFYAVQREFLELRKHLGDERADKFHQTGTKR